MVRFLTRVGCHLCDEARPLIISAAKRTGVALEEVDIDSDDELVSRYGARIPVLLGPEGEVLAEGVIEDQRALIRTMRGLSRSDR